MKINFFKYLLCSCVVFVSVLQGCSIESDLPDDTLIDSSFNGNVLALVKRVVSNPDEQANAITCVDFVYPVEISVYTSSDETIEIINISSDAAFLEFIENATYDAQTLVYPIDLIRPDDIVFTANDDAGLESIILSAPTDC